MQVSRFMESRIQNTLPLCRLFALMTTYLPLVTHICAPPKHQTITRLLRLIESNLAQFGFES